MDGCCPPKGQEKCVTVAVKLEDCDAPGTYDARVRRMQGLQASLAQSGLDSLDMVISKAWHITDGSNQDEEKASETPELDAFPLEVDNDEMRFEADSEAVPDTENDNYDEGDDEEQGESEDDDIDNPFA